VWTGRALNSPEPDIHEIGSIKTKMHRGVRKPLDFLILLVEGDCIEPDLNLDNWPIISQGILVPG
jgi:hypothetical protein